MTHSSTGMVLSYLKLDNCDVDGRGGVRGGDGRRKPG